MNAARAPLKTNSWHLQALPGERFMDYSELSLKVTRSSTLEVKRVLYTVPSRMIGENIRVHVYHDRLAFLWAKR